MKNLITSINQTFIKPIFQSHTKKFYLYLVIFIISLIVFVILILFIDQNENMNIVKPHLEKTTVVTYGHSGEVTVETTIITSPNVIVSIKTDGIKTPNYVQLKEIKLNNEHLKFPKFKMLSQKTRNGNYIYIVVDSAYKSTKSDTFYIKYISNIFTKYQKSLKEGRYLFSFTMYESILNSQSSINVNSNLITTSKNDFYSPTISRRNDFKIKVYNKPQSIKYFRTYTSVGYEQLLFLSYPDFIFEFNSYKSIGELIRYIKFEKLDYVNEVVNLKLKQYGDGKGVFFNIPFRKEYKNLEIIISINGKEFSPFPIDSITYNKIKDSLRIASPYYYIGPRGIFPNATENYIIIMFPLLKDEIALMSIKYKYDSKFILKKQDYFHYHFKYYLKYLPSAQNKNKIDISVPNGFHFELDNSNNMFSRLLETPTDIVYENINKPEYVGETIDLNIIKDGVTAFNIINWTIIIIFISTILIIIYYYTTKRQITSIIVWAMTIFQFILALILGWTSAEDIIEIFFYVDSYLLLLSILLLLLYKLIFKPPVNT